ncbi:hypothetical protein ACU686_10565 [Yinghuangia aomiensis]
MVRVNPVVTAAPRPPTRYPIAARSSRLPPTWPKRSTPSAPNHWSTCTSPPETRTNTPDLAGAFRRVLATPTA